MSTLKKCPALSTGSVPVHPAGGLSIYYLRLRFTDLLLARNDSQTETEQRKSKRLPRDFIFTVKELIVSVVYTFTTNRLRRHRQGYESARALGHLLARVYSGTPASSKTTIPKSPLVQIAQMANDLQGYDVHMQIHQTA
jgi:hypothetical protein